MTCLSVIWCSTTGRTRPDTSTSDRCRCSATATRLTARRWRSQHVDESRDGLLALEHIKIHLDNDDRRIDCLILRWNRGNVFDYGHRRVVFDGDGAQGND